MRRIAYLVTSLLLVTITVNAQVNAYQADQIADMAGCNTHFSWAGAYTDSFLTLKSRLQELGVRHIRETNMGRDTSFNDRINQLAGLGIKSAIICEPWWTWPENLSYFKVIKYLPNAPVEFIEYPNELFDYNGVTAAHCITDYSNFYNTYKGDTATAGIPMFGPSFSNDASGPGEFIDSGGYDMTNKMDYGNLHPYPSGAYVEGFQGGGRDIPLDSDITEYHLINRGNKPLVATETGYQLPFNTQWGVTGSVAAKYEPRILMWYLKKGIKYAYRYQLINDVDSLSGPANNYGILDSDCSRRPSFYAIRNTIKLFNDPGPAFTPGTLNYSLSGDTGGVNLQSMLFQKRNGNFLLVLWQAISSGTCNTNPDDYNNPAVAVKIKITGIQVGTALGYTPSFDSNAVASFSAIDTMTIHVSDHIYVLEIIPAEVMGNSMIIYPNPSSRLITISAQQRITGITISNTMGQILHISNPNAPVAQVNVADLPAGMYFIKVNGSEVKKFVKE